MAADYKVIASINPAINRPVWTDALYQWDHGITLEITGAEIPTDTPVAFSNQEDYGTALRMVSTTTGGVTSVKIPDTLLGEQIMCMGDFRVHAWVTVTNSDSAETIYHIIIPVHARPKPADYTDPGTEDPFADAIEQMQSLANQAQISATNAAASEQASEQAEQGAQEALEETQALANTTQQQITTAGQNQIDAIEQAGADQIENIQNASIEQAEKIAIKPSAEGNPISVTDSAEWRFQDFEADGWTEQTVTKGNQLITFPYNSAASEYSGINISINDDGSITANGTSTKGNNFYLNTNHKLLPGTYTLSENLQGTSEATLFIYDGASVLARGNSTFSISEEKTVNIYINWGKEGININGTYYPMLNYGSSSLTWEPYSGGYPSPRPEIKTRQLFNKETITADTYISDNNGIASPNKSEDNASDYIYVKAFDAIYVKSNILLHQWGAFYDSEKVFVSGFNGYNKSIQVPENAEYVRLTVQDGDLATFMVNAGSSVLPWEPYTVDAWPQPVINAAGYGAFDGILQNGYYSSSNGAYNSSTDYICNENPIYCQAGDKVTVNTNLTGQILMLFYKKDGTYISFYNQESVNTLSYNAPEDTEYCNFSVRKGVGIAITPADVGEVEVLINDGYPVEFDVHGENYAPEINISDRESVFISDFFKWYGKKTVYIKYRAKTDNPNGSLTMYVYYYNSKGERIGSNGYQHACGTSYTDVQTAASGVNANQGSSIDLSNVYQMSIRIYITSGTAEKFSVENVIISDQDISYVPPYHNTVRLISPRPLTKWDKLEKRDGKWGWVYKSNKEFLYGTETFDETYLPTIIFPLVPKGVKNSYDMPCNYSKKIVWSNSQYMTASIKLTDTAFKNAEEFKKWLAERNEEGNPFYYYYETAEEEWVELSESEQAAMKALETYYPTTVIQNSVNSQMRLQYVADPDHYLEQHYQAKLDEVDALAERVAALETNTIKEV